MSNLVMAAGIVLYTEQPDRQVLLLKHADRWDLPKGHAEPGETIEETALRETEEETGISRNQIRLDPAFEFRIEYDVQHSKRGKYRKQVIYFLGSVPAGLELNLTEHPSSKWWPWPVPPIQEQTIDPLMQAVAEHWRS